MNWFFDDNDWTDIALKIVSIVIVVFSFRWLIKLFSMSDGMKGLSVKDFHKLTSVVLFTWAAVYIIIAEAKRSDLTHQVYGEGYLIIIFGSLLFVLGLESVLDKIIEIITKLIELRKAKPKEDV